MKGEMTGRRKPIWTWQDGELCENSPGADLFPDRFEELSVCRSRRLLVYGARPYRINSRSGIRVAMMDFIDDHNSLWQRVDAFLSDTWGSYILMYQDKGAACSLIFGDPLHSIRIYYRREGGRFHFDSSQQVLVTSPIRWNRAFLGRAAATQFGISGQTPFADVAVIPAGHALLVDKNGQCETRRVWPGRMPLAGSGEERTKTALAEVCDRIRSSYDNVMVSLSGGVDSTAVAMVMRGIRNDSSPIEGLNFFSTNSPEFDERNFAKEAASAAGIELRYLEIESTPAFATLTLPAPPSIINPRFAIQRLTEEMNAILGGTHVMVDGQGGDLLFNSAPTAESLIDAFRDGGLGAGKKVIAKLASLNSIGYPRLLAHAIRSAVGIRDPDIAEAEARARTIGLLSAEFIDLGVRPASDAGLPASLGHKRPAANEAFHALMQMVEAQPDFGDPVFPRILSPLLTQPVVEAALSIPNYEHYDEKHDRIVLRKAAQGFIDCSPLWRRSKGALDASIIDGLLGNKARITSLLSDGTLVRERIINRENLSNAFQDVSLGQPGGAMALSLAVCVELFCRAWEDAADPRACTAQSLC